MHFCVSGTYMPRVQRQAVTPAGHAPQVDEGLSELCAVTSVCYVEHSSDRRAQVCKIPNLGTVALCLHLTHEINVPDTQTLFN